MTTNKYTKTKEPEIVKFSQCKIKGIFSTVIYFINKLIPLSNNFIPSSMLKLELN